MPTIDWSHVLQSIEADATSPEAIKTLIAGLTAVENAIEAATKNPFAVKAEHLVFQAVVSHLMALLPPDPAPATGAADNGG